MPLDFAQDLMTVIRARRAVRHYTDDVVDAPTIRELLDAAVQAPTAMHLEPWGFVVVQDKARLRRWSDRAKALLLEERPALEPAAAGATGAAGAAAHPPRYLAMLSDPAFNIFHDAGTLVVVCRRSGGAFADADCWLAAENLMLAATARGLGTCCIGFAVQLLNTPDLRRELGIPDAGAAVAPVVVGVPRETPAPVPRHAPQLLSWLHATSTASTTTTTS